MWGCWGPRRALTLLPPSHPTETQQGHHGPETAPEGRCCPPRGPSWVLGCVRGWAPTVPHWSASRPRSPRRVSCSRLPPRSWRRRRVAGSRRSRTTCPSTARPCTSPAPCPKCRYPTPVALRPAASVSPLVQKVVRAGGGEPLPPSHRPPPPPGALQTAARQDRRCGGGEV